MTLTLKSHNCLDLNKVGFYFLCFWLCLCLSNCDENSQAKKDTHALQEAEMALQKAEQEIAELRLLLNNIGNDIATKQLEINQNESNKGRLQGNLVNLKSALVVAKERAENAKEWKMFRSQKEREAEIEAAANSVYSLERNIIETETEFNGLKVKAQEYNAQLFELKSREGKLTTDLQVANRAETACINRIKGLGGKLKL